MENRTAPLVIGVDGGGSGCRAAIAQAGAVLATAEGGPANVTTDIESSIHNVRWAIEAAATQVGLAGQLGGAYAYFGLAGAQSEEQQAQVAAAFRFAHLEVAEDRPAAVVGALGAREGCVISAGTGTIAGVLRGGQFRFVGGWGFQLSDHASGAWLGRMALEWALAAWERLRDHSDLTRALM
ncbi:MAG: BadF/BadG/BcrA/BcrD ATPase family protein, partial [Pseudomonadota bacterium]